MPLFRASYRRAGKPAQMTFAAAALPLAADFAYTVLQRIVTASGGSEIESIQPIKSRFPRRRHPLIDAEANLHYPSSTQSGKPGDAL